LQRRVFGWAGLLQNHGAHTSILAAKLVCVVAAVRQAVRAK
jgi:hypothetical protein